MADTEITLHWYLPTYGDSRLIIGGGHGGGIYHGEREPTLYYLTQIALAAEANGFESLLTPTGQWCADSWVTDAALLARTSRIKFLIAFRPGLVSTPLIAQQTQTLQELSGGRVLLNVVVGGEDIEQRAYGDYTTKEQRYARADEALALAQDLWTSQEPITRQGTYETVENAQLAKRPETTPRIFFGGSSQPGIEVAGRRADVYLTWGETPDKVEENWNGSGNLLPQLVGKLSTVSGCTSLPGILRSRPGRKRSGCSIVWTRKKCRKFKKILPVRNRKGSACKANCTGKVRILFRVPTPVSWKSLPTCGRASDCCAVARAPRW